jgi:hypothetical protein
MSNLVAKIVALLSLAGIAVATITLATGSSEAAKKNNLPGSVVLGGECAAFQDCRLVFGKVVECRCTDQSSRPVCVADLDVGQDCSTSISVSSVCRPGTRCTATGPHSAKAVCIPAAKAGEACGPGTGGCEDPAFCDSNHVCVLGQAELGQTCGQHAECKAPYVCPGRKHVCSRPAKVGEACETNSDGRSECVADAGCNGNRCVAKKIDGAGCTFDEECLTGLCGTSGCGLGPALGNVIVSCGL